MVPYCLHEFDFLEATIPALLNSSGTETIFKVNPLQAQDNQEKGKGDAEREKKGQKLSTA